MEGISHLTRRILELSKEDLCTFIHDKNFKDLSAIIKSECDLSSTDFHEIHVENDGSTQIDEVRNLLLNKDSHNVFIFGLCSKKINIWHIPERKKAKYELKKRLANLVGSPAYLKKKCEEKSEISKGIGETLKSLLAKSQSIRVESKNGTSLEARISKESDGNNKYSPYLETGNYSLPGSGGDYPTGEVGFGPNENSVNGRIVFDYKIQHVGFLNGKPLKLEIQKDHVKSIIGEPEDEKKLNELLESDMAYKYLCEISIGLNPNIYEDENIYFIPEEKKLSTMHFGFGGNLSYGNRRGPHFDGVIKDPNLFIDNQMIMDNGKFNSRYFTAEINEWLERKNLMF